jgi:putative ABC transport system ATP-binding protein
MSILKIEDLNKSYDTEKANFMLKGINLNINQGEFVSIMGSSGSGKSTLLNIIGILDEADSGIYELDGFPIKHLTEVKAANIEAVFLDLFSSHSI